MSDILAQIASERNERVQDVFLDLPIPSWGGSLVGRFNVIGRRDMEKFSKRQGSRDADTDFLIMSTRELYALDEARTAQGERMEENDDYVRIEDENNHPVLWTKVFAEKIGKTDLTSGRQVLDYCFRHNGIAISGMAIRLFRWMQNTDAEVADTIVGE